jgi:hypothetical protein
MESPAMSTTEDATENTEREEHGNVTQRALLVLPTLLLWLAIIVGSVTLTVGAWRDESDLARFFTLIASVNVALGVGMMLTAVRIVQGRMSIRWMWFWFPLGMIIVLLGVA